jgi:hypothetical protein
LNHPQLNFGLHISIIHIDKNAYKSGNMIIGINADQVDKHPFLVGYFASSEAFNDQLAGK